MSETSVEPMTKSDLHAEYIDGRLHLGRHKGHPVLVLDEAEQEWLRHRMRRRFVAQAHARARKALNDPDEEPSIDECPQCGGLADNGYSRSVPPEPYYCTKCMETSGGRD